MGDHGKRLPWDRYQYSVIVDGVERKPYTNVTKTIIFSPDSQRVAYMALS